MEKNSTNEEILNQLNDLIRYTYQAEEQFKKLNDSHIQLNETISELIEFLPDALWVIEDSGKIFLLNSKAKELNFMINNIDYKSNREFVHDGKSYVLRSNRNKDKTIVIITENTKQKQKDRLAVMGQMSAHLSHEIRNPIGSISLIASTLFKSVNIKNKPLVYEIQKAVNRVERIINATLIYSKEVVAKKEYFNLSELNDMIFDEIEYYSYSKNIKININFGDIEIYADINLLILLFTNLVFNAIDSIEENEEENGEIKIDFIATQANYIFNVFDSGKPVIDNTILFNAFNSTKKKGNGLGLVLCESIAKAHSGSITFMGNDPKYFQIMLPIFGIIKVNR